MRLLIRRPKSAAAKRGQKRPRVVPWWRTWTARLLLVGVPLAGLAGMAAWGWLHHWPERVAAWAWDVRGAAMADLGLVVREVYVVGRSQTPRDNLIQALGVHEGDLILDVELAAARERLQALSWVREASVQRVLPGTIVVRIKERVPLALWQNERRFALIDGDGEVLTRDSLERFADLIVVVGPDAPPHAAELVALVRTQPELGRRVRAAVRVGGRRWNLRLDGGVDVRLPETDAQAAWSRLARYQRKYGVLERDVAVLDLRFAEKVIVRRASPPAEPPATAGQDT